MGQHRSSSVDRLDKKKCNPYYTKDHHGSIAQPQGRRNEPRGLCFTLSPILLALPYHHRGYPQPLSRRRDARSRKPSPASSDPGTHRPGQCRTTGIRWTGTRDTTCENDGGEGDTDTHLSVTDDAP